MMAVPCAWSRAANISSIRSSRSFWTRVGARMPIVPALPALLRAWDRQGGLEALFEQADAQRLHRGARAGRGICRCRLAALSRRCRRGQRADGGVGAAIGAVAQSARSRGPGEAMGLAALARVARSGHRFGVGRCAGALPCQQVVAVAEGGLAGDEQQWLDYVRYVVETGETAADRMLRLWRQARGTPEMRRAQVCRQRAVLSRGRQYLSRSRWPGPSALRFVHLVGRQQNIHRWVEADAPRRFQIDGYLGGAFQTWLMLRGFSPLKMRAMVWAWNMPTLEVVRLGQAHQQAGLDFVGPCIEKLGTRAAQRGELLDGRRGDAPVLGERKRRRLLLDSFW